MAPSSWSVRTAMPNYGKPQEFSGKQYGSNWVEALQVDHSYFFVEGPVVY